MPDWGFMEWAGLLSAFFVLTFMLCEIPPWVRDRMKGK